MAREKSHSKGNLSKELKMRKLVMWISEGRAFQAKGVVNMESLKEESDVFEEEWGGHCGFRKIDDQK